MFKDQVQQADYNYAPSHGTIIFFYWEGDGITDRTQYRAKMQQRHDLHRRKQLRRQLPDQHLLCRKLSDLRIRHTGILRFSTNYLENSKDGYSLEWPSSIIKKRFYPIILLKHRENVTIFLEVSVKSNTCMMAR